MVGYQNIRNIGKDVMEKFAKTSKISGVIFLLLGLLGILFPTVMSLATAYFISCLFIISALVIGSHTWQNDRKDWLGWLKTFIYLLSGIFVAVFPLPSVAALGIILAIHFFFDGFASVVLAFQLKGEKRWWLILLNGVISIFLGIILLINWPFSSIFYVGLFVGISMFFDGIVLLSMAKAVDRLRKELYHNDV